MAGPNSRHPYGSAPQSRINAVPETADGEADTANLPDPSATFRQQARLRLNALKVGSTADDRSGANISRGYVPGVGRISAHDTMNPAARAADWESAFGNSRTIMGARPVTWEQRRASDAAHDAAVTDSRLPDGHRPVIRYDSAAGGGTAQPPPPVTPQPAGQPSAAPSFNFPTPSISFDRHTAPPIQVPPPDPAGAHGGWGMPAADPTGANGGWGIPSATAMPGAAAGAMPGNVPEGYHDGVHGIVNTYNGMAARNVNGAGDAAQRQINAIISARNARENEEKRLNHPLGLTVGADGSRTIYSGARQDNFGTTLPAGSHYLGDEKGNETALNNQINAYSDHTGHYVGEGERPAYPNKPVLPGALAPIAPTPKDQPYPEVTGLPKPGKFTPDSDHGRSLYQPQRRISAY